MASNINGVLVKIKMGKYSTHGCGLGIKSRHSLPGSRVIFFEILSKDQEVAESSLFKHTEEICKEIMKRLVLANHSQRRCKRDKENLAKC